MINVCLREGEQSLINNPKLMMNKRVLLAVACFFAAAVCAHAQFSGSNLPVVQIRSSIALARSPKVAGTVTIRVSVADSRVHIKHPGKRPI